MTAVNERIAASAMLRAQHEAIRQLREACEYTVDACKPFGFDRITEQAKAVLAATEEFK